MLRLLKERLASSICFVKIFESGYVFQATVVLKTVVNYCAMSSFFEGTGCKNLLHQ